MHIFRNKRGNKKQLLKPLAPWLAGMFVLFGAVSCNQGGESESNALADEEHVRDKGFDRGFDDEENELVSNNRSDFERWDANQDQQWSREEFEAASGESQFYAEWDVDGDGTLTEDELNEGVFNTYDTNQDGVLDNDEYEAFVSARGEDGTIDFQEWDADQDKEMDASEFNSLIKKNRVSSERENEEELPAGDRVTDDNRILGESEINEGLFRSWDANADGFISREEYDNFARKD